MITRTLVAVAGFSLVSPVQAATFSQNQGGLTGSSSVIRADGTGDYPSLYDAAADFSAFPGGAQGHYTFYIDSDTTEPTNVAFGNLTNGYKVAIKPLGAPRTVIFTSDTPNAGAAGHLLIGSRTTESYHGLVKTDGFLLDGALEGTTGSLTLVAFTGPGYASDRNRCIINVVGDSDAVQVRNCHAVHDLNDEIGYHQVHGVQLTPVANGSPELLAPDNATIANCHIDIGGLRAGAAIRSIVPPTTDTYTSGAVLQNVRVEDCVLVAATRGIDLMCCGDAVVQRNRVTMVHAPTGHSISAISYQHSNGVDGQRIFVSANNVVYDPKFGQSHLGVSGIYIGNPFNFSGIAQLIEIENNMVALSSVYDVRIGNGGGIWVSASSRTTRIFHNSVLLNSMGSWYWAVSGIVPATTRWEGARAEDLLVYNNLVSANQAGLDCFVFPPKFTSDGNLVHVERGAHSFFLGNFGNWLLPQWQARSGQDRHSQQLSQVPPFTSNTDLHLTTLPLTLKPGIFITDGGGVNRDIDGDLRDPRYPVPGADELVISGPDLSVTWLGTRATRLRDGRIRLRARLTVQNPGTQDTPSHNTVAVFLSEDAQHDASDTEVRSLDIRALRAGDRREWKKSYRLPASCSGKYLIAVADPDNQLAEASEWNNSVVYGPLP